MTYLEAAQYILNNEDAIVEACVDNDDLAVEVVSTWDIYCDLQRALIDAVEQYRSERCYQLTSTTHY